MADNGIWFKLWIGADEDPDLGDLPLDDFARWCKFGLYLKKFGTEGSIELKPPCQALQNKFQVASFNAVIDCIRKFPNCSVTGVTNATVTWTNWQKYQGDNSRERVRKFRQSVTAKKRREEMRGEEMRGEEIRRDENKIQKTGEIRISDSPKQENKSDLDERIKKVADRIFTSDRKRYLRLIQWIKQCQKYQYADDLIAWTLMQCERYLPTADNWWAYLDNMIVKFEKDFNARETERRSQSFKEELNDILYETKH